MFTVLPAIDVARGRLAVWTPGGPEPIDAFDGSPLRAARAFVAAGARWLHMVDMDLAFEGTLASDGIVRELVRDVPDVAIQVSGGIRRVAEADVYVAAGASRVVLGSVALADPQDAIRTIERLGDRVLVGIEVDAGGIRPRGRASEGAPPMDLMPTLGWLVAGGAQGFLVTSISRIGGGLGPDDDLIRRVTRAGRPTLAAGGIRTLDDLRRVRDAGAVGAVVGSAALDGSLDLSEVFAWAGP